MQSETMTSLKDKMKEMLAQCTPEQQELFHKMYKNGIDGIPDNKMDWAFCQIERTLKKNEASNVKL